MAQVYLNKGEEKRLARGHPWIYRDEVDTGRTPLADLAPGQVVDVFSHRGRWLGNGYANPKSLICVRVVSRNREYPFCASLIVHRLKVALGLRERWFDRPYYRAVFGESDGLPGLVIDRYGDVCVIQITTAGMEVRREEIVGAVEKVLRPAAILLRCDQDVRSLEGLEKFTETALGVVSAEIELHEHNTGFRVPLIGGQKTGWYYDQRDNRARLLPAVRDLRVLDLFSYLGAWGVQAAVHGAEHVLCVDSASQAVDRIRANAKVNRVDERVEAVRMDAFDALEQLRADNRRFDVVILDPPAFIKHKKDTRQGLDAYRRLNQEALRVLTRDGLLMTCSCSFRLSREALMDTAIRAGRHLGRQLSLLYEGGQALDHPVQPMMPETRYLKALMFRVLPR
ncbi:MAG: class I SAM-dependent rRNA methyltransferase [Gammaproteobacteria bacterium]|nr:class I SAM-dependent rRNA methyltransferase [Gammaproteobacteria bacterium]